MRITSSLRLLVLSVAVTACNHNATDTTHTSTVTTAQAQKPTATPERLVERSKARWDLIVRKDWIAAYDYLSPEQKKDLTLQDFLRGKENHVYANPHLDTVLKIDGEQGYLRGSVLWTPTHPQIKQSMVPPGQSLTQELQMIETWRWVDGDWQYVAAERDYEFLEKHPELLKDSKTTAPTGTPPKGASVHGSKLDPEPKAAAK